jgi:hypothetical protein
LAKTQGMGSFKSNFAGALSDLRYTDLKFRVYFRELICYDAIVI